MHSAAGAFILCFFGLVFAGGSYVWNSAASDYKFAPILRSNESLNRIGGFEDAAASPCSCSYAHDTLQFRCCLRTVPAQGPPCQ